MTPPMKSEVGRKLYGVNLKHGTWYNRLWLDGPSGPEGEAKFESVRAEAEKLLEQSGDVVQAKERVLRLFATNDFHQCDT